MTPIVIWLTTVAVSVVSALVPFINAELYLLSVVALAPAGMALPLALAATVGQMIGKVVMYYIAQGALRVPGKWMQGRLTAAEGWLQQRKNVGGLALLASATTGIPPFYAMTVACGILRFRFLHFLAVGFFGRLVRFSLLVLIPQYFKR